MSDIIFIWLGGPLLEEYLVNISNYSKVFSDFQVELIVNDSSLHLLRKKQLVSTDFSYYDILLKRGITVIHYQEVIESIKKIYESDGQLLENLKKLERIILTEENGLHNYAAASDIIRGIRLLKGGIYIDLDVTLDTKLAQQNIKELEKLLFKYDQQYPKLVLSYFALNEKNMIDSYIINAPKNSEVVKKFLDYVVINYRIAKNVILFARMGNEGSKFSLLDIKRVTQQFPLKRLFIKKSNVEEIKKMIPYNYSVKNESFLVYITLPYELTNDTINCVDYNNEKFYQVYINSSSRNKYKNAARANITAMTSGPRVWIQALKKEFQEEFDILNKGKNICQYEFSLTTGWAAFPILVAPIERDKYIIEEKNLNNYGMTHKRDNYWMKDVNVISGINTNKGKFFEC
ncbi:MAG: hypothetical protein sL5_10850 [Candidatus Mesenet longicola]|uniref:Uncharacterized protein n=1 Tax=Candidatus Mesenet longicola TaxID=1892558 RepID=A0A8J3MND4_9RICK|nr:MAG: hypothetical protein sGL2_09770 [Candidatus Mesenet longicola]GHM60092.1 MAG: hypothetical protein sL5_10850 [Candidatus Mesenet longicola]